MFDRFRTDGHRVRFGLLWCSWIPDATAVPPRVAFAIGRPFGSAVMRNRMRRRLRARFDAAARDGLVPAGWYLVGATPPAGALGAVELRAGVDGLLGRVREMAAA